MLVLAQVSSMKTRREGSSRPWYFFHCARRRATSGRSCSLACKLFFEGDALVHEEVPDGKVPPLDPARGELRPEASQGDVRLLGQTSQQPLPLALQRIRPPAANLVRGRAAGRAIPLRPLYHACHADLESRCDNPATPACRHGGHNALA